MGKLMDKKLGDKKLKEYWKVIKLPVYAGIAISLLSLATAFVPLLGMFTGALVGLVGLAISLYIGWSAVKNYKYDLKHSAFAGGIAGVITGLAGGIIGAITAMVLLGAASSAMGAYGTAYGGAAAGAVGGFAMASAIAGIVMGPVWGAIMGAILAAIGALAAENL